MLVVRQINLPDILKLIKKILLISRSFKFNNQKKTIEQWRKYYIKEELRNSNSLNNIEKFNTFVFNGLMMQSLRGDVGEKLKKAADNIILSFKDVNKENIEKIFRQSGYRLKNRRNVPIDFLDVFTKEYNKNWNKYFDEAKKNYRKNFIEDDVKKINGVGFKTRDLALSCFLKEYSANDIHVVRVITRTGLILYGYGNVNIGTDMSSDNSYLFIRSLIISFADKTSYSPGEIDRIFWHFGRNICKSKPLCDKCPIKNICLTGKNIK